MVKTTFNRLIACFSACFFLITASSTASEEAKKILFKAGDNTAYSSFKATNPITKGKETHITLYHSFTEEGQFLEKYERKFSNRDHRVFLLNQEGTFFWFLGPDGRVLGNTVIKNSYFPLDANEFLKVLVWYSKFNIGKYGIAPVTYRGASCYRITVDYPIDNSTIAQISNLTLEQVEKHQDYYRASYVSRMIFFVRRSDPFILSCEYYNPSGKKIQSWDWGKLEFMTFESNFFAIPEGASVKVTQSVDELKKIGQKIHKNQQPSKLLATVRRTFLHNFPGIVKYASIIGISLAVLCLAGALWLKLKKKKS